MGGSDKFVWIVVIPNNESVENGIITAKTLLAVKTALKVVAVISSDISQEMIDRLNGVFEEVHVHNISLSMLENGMNRRDALLLSILKTKSIRKAIVMAPGVLISAQCDHLFDSEDDGILVQDRESKHWLMVRITPNSWESKKLAQILPDHKIKNLSSLLDQVIFDSKELELDVQNIDSGDKWAMWEQHSEHPSNKDMNIKDWIAVVGMSCKFPQANNLAEYWDLLDKGVNTSSHPPASRLSLVEEMDVGTRGNFLACPVDQFDASFFGMSPKEAAITDPQARLLLECSWEALEHANLNPDKLRGSQTGVFYGSWLQDYRDHFIQESSAGQNFLRKYLANGLGATAAKLSFFYGFTGPNVATENACSSSMVALHLACASLRRKECSMALVCGTNLILHNASQARVLSKDGICKTFDTRADGYSRAEGIAVLVLKRYSDAIDDGDKIQAVIRSSAVSQEGMSNSLGSPTVGSECRAMRAVLAQARLDPSEVDYVEAHATGTAVGDPIEAAAIVEAYSSPQPRHGPLWIGSGKTNIGHTEACAGLAGIIKVILSMHHNKIPRHLHLIRQNPAVNFDSVSGAIPVEAQPWPANETRPRIAGVSSFGISGTDAHAIIQEAPLQINMVPSPANQEEGKCLLLLSAKSPKALEQLMERYTDFLETSSDSLQNICLTAATCRSHHYHRLAILASKKEEMCGKILEEQSRVGSVKQLSNPLRVLYTFPGLTGKQKLGPIRELYKNNSYFQQVMQECDGIFKQVNPSRGSLLEILFSANPSSGNVPPEYCLLFTTYQYALAKLWDFCGAKAEMVVGHSQGEFTAAIISGMLPLSEFYKLTPIYKIMMDAQRLGEVQMVAVNGDVASTEKLVQEFLESATVDSWLDVACHNAPNQTVVIGPTEVAQTFAAFSVAQDVRATPFATLYPAHSRRLQAVEQDLKEVLNEISFQPASKKVAFISSATGQIVSNLDANHLYKILKESVKFTTACDTILAEQQADNLVLLEMGVDSALTKISRSNFECKELQDSIYCLPSFGKSEGDVMEILGKLYELGVIIDLQNFYKSMGFQGRKVTPLPGYPFQRKSYWLERKNVAQSVPCKTSNQQEFIEQKAVQSTNTISIKENSRYLKRKDEVSCNAILKAYLEFWEPTSFYKQESKTHSNAQENWLLLEIEDNVDNSIKRPSLDVPTIQNYFLEKTGREVSQAFLNTKLTGSSLSEWIRKQLSRMENLKGIILWIRNFEGHRLERSCRTAVEPLLLLTQHLLASKMCPSPKVMLVTEGAWNVTGSHIPKNPFAVMAWAFMRNALVEIPGLRAKCVDLEPTDEFGNILECLVTELNIEDKETEVACRGGIRYVRRLKSEKAFASGEKSDISRTQLQFNNKSTYLITGGNGAIGFALCKWMLRQGARYVVLVGRRPASEKRLQEIAELNRKYQAHVICREVDISNFAECQALLQVEMANMLNYSPLHGVHHCAGIASDKALAAQDWSNFEKVFEAKQRQPHIFGNPGQANYVAANAFLDAVAQMRRSAGLPALAINWGQWKAGLGETVNSDIFHAFTLEQGVDMMDRIMREGRYLHSADCSNVVAGAFDFNRISSRAPHYRTTFLKNVLEDKVKLPVNLANVQHNTDIFSIAFKTASNLKEKYAAVNKFLLEQVSQTLGYSQEEKIDRHTKFSDKGMDSILSIEFTNRIYAGLENAIGKQQQGDILDLDEHDTLQKLTEFLIVALQKNKT